MEPEDIVTFRQEDFQSSCFAAFERMRANGILCDLKITLQDRAFKAHRVILAAGIPYFQSLYEDNGEETSEVDISRKDLDSEAVESLIQFAYSGNIDISLDKVSSLLRASDILQVTQVFDACVEFLLESFNDDMAVRIHNLAHEFAIQNLIESSNRYILQNFDKICKHDDFLSLPHSCFKDIISEDDLNVSSEETVFEAVIRWIKASPFERQELLPELLGEVRMVYLDADYLVNRVASEELVRTSEPCVNLLEDVKNYHLLPKGRVSFSNLKTQPRKFSHINGGIYAIFYCHSSGYSVYHCDFDNGRISQNLASKEGPHGAVFGVASVNDRVYMFQEKTIRTFHVKTLEWKVLDQPKHSCMKGSTLVTYGDLIYCFGSLSADFSNKVRCFDTTQNKWLKDCGRMRTGRYNSAGAVLGENIYVTGGFWGYLLPSYMYLMGYSGGNTVEKYSPSRKRCRKVAPMLTPRENHFCAGMRGKLYVCGGGLTAESLNSAEVFDPLTGQWSFICSMPSPRSSFSFVSYDRRLYAIETDRGIVYYEIFESGSNTWNAGLSLRNESGLEGGLRFAVSFPANRY